MNNLKDGIWLIKKQAGPTSHDVVAQARRILGHRDIGHCGTLDPMAEGLLILTSGEATKISQYLLDGHKQYRVGVKFGMLTDTLDVTGTVLNEMPFTGKLADVVQRADQLQGDFQWPVPVFSAVKVNGEKLYEKAHRGETNVETPVKTMRFWDVEFLEEKDQTFYFTIRCSKGSYIRTWCQKLGESLGNLGCMAYLERTGSSPFELDNALTLEEISRHVTEGQTPRNYRPLKQCLPHLKTILIKGKDESLMQNGVISHDLRLRLIQAFNPAEDEIVQVKGSTGNLISLIGLEKQKGFQVRRVFKQNLC